MANKLLAYKGNWKQIALLMGKTHSVVGMHVLSYFYNTRKK